MKTQDKKLLWMIFALVTLDVLSSIIILGVPGTRDANHLINNLYSLHPAMVVIWLPFVMLIAMLFWLVSEYLEIMSHFRYTCVIYGFLVMMAIGNNISLIIGVYV